MYLDFPSFKERPLLYSNQQWKFCQRTDLVVTLHILTVTTMPVQVGIRVSLIFLVIIISEKIFRFSLFSKRKNFQRY